MGRANKNFWRWIPISHAMGNWDPTPEMLESDELAANASLRISDRFLYKVEFSVPDTLYIFSFLSFQNVIRPRKHEP